MNREKQVAIAAKLFQSRSSLRQLAPTYSTGIVEYMRIVATAASEYGGELQAGLTLATQMIKLGHDASALWLLAATLELIEPDEMTPKMEIAK